MLASLVGHAETVQLLLSTGRAGVKQVSDEKWTALMYAADEGRLEVVKALLHESDPQHSNGNGVTALMLAASGGHAEVVQLLIHAPGMKYAKHITDSHWCPLMAASYAGHSEVVRMLIGVPGVDINCKAECSSWLLWPGVGSPPSHICNEMSLAAFAPDKTWRTPLAVASTFGRVEVVRELLRAPGIDTNLAPKSTSAPLELAVSTGHAEIVRLLLASPGTIIFRPDSFKRSVLSHACESGHAAVVAMLLAAPGVEVNAVNRVGQSPLSYAARNGNAEVVRMLLARPDTDAGLLRMDGESALSLARKYGHTKVVEMLEQHLEDNPDQVRRGEGRKRKAIFKVLRPIWDRLDDDTGPVK